MCTLGGCVAILPNQTDSRSIKSQLAPVFRWRWKRAGKFGTNAPLVVPNEIAHPLLQCNILGGYTAKNRFYYGAKTLVKSSSSPSSSSPRQRTIMYGIIRGRVAKHLLGRLQQRRSTEWIADRPGQSLPCVWTRRTNCERFVSDEQPRKFVTDRFTGNPLKCAHTASHIILFLFPPRSNHLFFVFDCTPPHTRPVGRRRCIMIVQMRAARGLPGSFKDPSPS
jgi:hypothetical protein